METFNGVELLISSNVSFHIAGDACPMGLGSWNFEKLEYFSQRFPHKLQDPLIPIHVKEFLCVILAIKLWGSQWRGKKAQVYKKQILEFYFPARATNFNFISPKIGTFL